MNFQRYLWDPPLASPLLPTDGAQTYRVRQSLFTALVITTLRLGVAFVRRRS